MRDRKPWYRKDKRAWYVWFNGRQKRLAADKAEAYRLWHLLESGPVAEAGAPTIQEAAAVWLAASRERCKASTVKQRERILGRLVKDRGDVRVGAFDAPAAVSWLRGTGWGGTLQWVAAGMLRMCLKVPGLRVPGPVPRGAESLVDPGTHAALLAAACAAYKPILRVLHATGCRPGELCRVEARHMGEGAFTLQEHKAERAGRPRVIVLPGDVWNLCRGIAEAHPTGPLFLGRNGQELTPEAVRKCLTKACRRLGLPRVTPYSYRHTFATEALTGGIPEAVVAALLGHSVAMLHRHYSHLTGRVQVLREFSEKIR
jgi:integrase